MEIEQKFKLCFEQLKLETQYLSFIDINNFYYKEIIKLGEPVIKIIFDHICLYGGDWYLFAALHELTGENLITEDAIGKFDMQEKLWLDYAEQKGFI